MTDKNRMIERAAEICVEKHRGQVDRAGKAYMLHPMRVAMRCETDDERIVALLHDTIEDTDVTAEYLLEEGFPQYIVDAVVSVSRQEGEKYVDFVKRSALNPIGRKVKLRDLEDNMNPMRLDEVTPKAAKRLTKYIKAHRYITDYIAALTGEQQPTEY